MTILVLFKCILSPKETNKSSFFIARCYMRKEKESRCNNCCFMNCEPLQATRSITIHNLCGKTDLVVLIASANRICIDPAAKNICIIKILCGSSAKIQFLIHFLRNRCNAAESECMSGILRMSIINGIGSIGTISVPIFRKIRTIRRL